MDRLAVDAIGIAADSPDHQTPYRGTGIEEDEMAGARKLRQRRMRHGLAERFGSGGRRRHFIGASTGR